ncbi:MAG: molybdate ABC transporter substrate-binding protein [Treponema sp.]|jgi:molybdate transport system substrate-binding protein|nr:molybdate ABC transporter substrate-binding protein [Treponema sp.]
MTEKNPVMRRVLFGIAAFLFLLAPGGLFAGARRDASPASPAEPAPAAAPAPVTIMVAAAASLEYSYRQELIPRFQSQYPWITVEGVYDSSGRLQTQIEGGLEADVFMSAAERQMNALRDNGFIAPDSVVPLLQNKIVLIKPAGTATTVTSFDNITNAAVIALGDPASVPAGQYAREALTNLGNWDAASAKASFGGNVTEVLNWVGEASAEVGVVYATDAATTDKVEVIAELPDGILSTKVIYPVGRVSSSARAGEADMFIRFLQTPEALDVFKAYGFSPNN